MCCAGYVLEMKLPAARYILRGLNPQGVQRGSIKKKKNLAVNTSFVKGSRCCLKTLEEKSNNCPFFSFVHSYAQTKIIIFICLL